MPPMIMLTTSFRCAACPVSPRKRCSLPMASRAGRASSYKGRSPAARMISVPCSAGPLVPETGASRKRPPAAAAAAAMDRLVPASTVDMSM